MQDRDRERPGPLGEKRMAAYSATKGAVIAFTKAFAAEVGRANVRVNAVCPGVTRTPMTASMSDEIRTRAARLYPLGRLGEPADIASMIAFLASDQTSWVTGQAVSVSGGFGRA
jgi:NAD(P)-dependent dehydrogenase (short-subunit alcohol dehydrogenase family)